MADKVDIWVFTAHTHLPRTKVLSPHGQAVCPAWGMGPFTEGPRFLPVKCEDKTHWPLPILPDWNVTALRRCQNTDKAWVQWDTLKYTNKRRAFENGLKPFFFFKLSTPGVPFFDYQELAFKAKQTQRSGLYGRSRYKVTRGPQWQPYRTSDPQTNSYLTCLHVLCTLPL